MIRRSCFLSARPLALTLLIGALTGLFAGFTFSTSAAPAVEYNRDIRPLLSDKCFFCHGPDAGRRKGKLRLDIRAEAIKNDDIVPGKPKDSEVVRRILSTDPEDVMPPHDSNKTLTVAQKELLRRWIAAGAQYQEHWAYEKPVKPVTPAKSDPIDFLIQKRLKEIHLAPSAPADRATLARRLHLDLVGLPPKPEEVETFIHDKSPDAYSKLVEKLLASPHYGERMAIGWLDVVRFADTIGYHSDNGRNIWPYRDYVIKAFNDNKPFDVFTREQLAGDLLPHSGQEQKVSSAFNRLLLSTEEGGAQAADYEARMLTDRVRAVGAVWLGQTIGCAQCHDHKFDPIKSRDFYSMGAFFADIKEPIIGGREPGMMVPNEDQKAELAKRAAEIKRLEGEYNAPHPEFRAGFEKWQQQQTEKISLDAEWSSLHPAKVESTGGAKLQVQPDHSILASTEPKPDKDTYLLEFTNLTDHIQGFRLEALTHDSMPAHGPGRADNGNFVLTRVIANIQRANGTNEPITFASARATYEQTSGADNNVGKHWGAASVIDAAAKEPFTGWAILPEAGKSQQMILDCGKPMVLNSGDTLKFELRQDYGGHHTLGHFRLSSSTNETAVRTPFDALPSKEIADILQLPAEKRSAAQKNKLWDDFKMTAPEFATLRTQLADARKAHADYQATIPLCIVSVAAETPRTVRILPRGNFLVTTGEVVQPALPGYLKASWQKMEKPRLTRLDLADWLVSRDNPLTARVVVNRMWKQFFGAGLARPLDDFGAQGDPPKDQELLDWLACEFMDSDWDIKHMVRLMVNSRTYKQTSVLSKKAMVLDPYDREFSAQGRWRLDAELVRDNALAIAGLLAPQIGGPSVKPYQPEGYWDNLNFPPRTWQHSDGADLYRRGLYTWWQRSYLQPSFAAFDAPTREECCVERNRSNIPQQALALLNDPTYVEASRVFATRIVKDGGNTPEARISWAWEQALDRAPRADELAVARDLFTRQLAEYQSDPKSAEALLHIGMTPVPEKCDPAELAAWTSVGRLVLNLHEIVTRD